MRKITQDAIDAFTAGVEFSRDNTRVEVRPFQGSSVLDSVILVLHGNPIARYVKSQGMATLQVCDGNHQTVTTKDRLNGIPGVRVNQKAGRWYLNGVEWDGHWAHVGNVMIVKRVGDRCYRVEYPRSATRDPMEFTTRTAARAFAEVEASNHGYKLLAELEEKSNG